MTDFTKIIDRLAPPPDGESPVRVRMGIVTAVTSSGVSISLGGTVVPNVARVGAVAVGMVCPVLTWVGALLVLGASFSGEQVKYESSGTFVKADYPGLRAVRVRVQGAGGGSGGVSTTAAGQGAASGGGGGGGYSEKFILASDLAASETVTVGAGGSNGAIGANDAGDGGASSFGSHCTGNGGVGSVGFAAVATPQSGGNGGVGGTATGGNLNIQGSGGGATDVFNGRMHRAQGGGSVLGGHGTSAANTSGAGGTSGQAYGGGAGGAFNTQSQGTARGGGTGGPGIVLVEPYF